MSARTPVQQVDFYLHTARAADRRISPGHPDLVLPAPADGVEPIGFDTATAALDWLDAELPELGRIRALALRTGQYAAVWQLAVFLNGHYVRRGLHQDQREQWQDAEIAARSLGRRDRPEALVTVYRYAGQAATRLGDHQGAAVQLNRAVALAEESGDATLQAWAAYIFAWAREMAGDDREALGHAERARRLFVLSGDSWRETDALNAVGWYHTRLGEDEQAWQCGQAALELARRHGYTEGEAAALDSLGLLAQEAGRHREALVFYGSALALCRRLSNDYQEAGILQRLATSQAATGEFDDARHSLISALELYRAQDRPTELAGAAEQLAATTH